MYWSKSADFSLNEIDLVSGTSTKINVPDSKLQIKLMTMEPKNRFLFWYNTYTCTIQMLDVGKNDAVPVNITDAGGDSITG